MAKDTISQYSKTAGSNTDIQSVSIAEGMAPSDVNNAMRELMVDLAALCDGTQSLTTLDVTGDITGGTLNADGDTSAGDNAAVGYTAGEGLILTGQGSTNDITIKNDADADVITIATGGTDVEISTGNLVIGTSGKGIDFSATADGTGTMSSELLDDYEEGSFSPTMYGFSTAGTPNYDVRGGAYTKIGQLVHFTCYIRMNSLTGAAGDLVIGGLPYTSNANSVGTVCTLLTDTVAWTNVSGGADYLLGNLWASSTSVGIMEITDNAAWAYVSAASSIASTDQIYLSGSYRV